MNKLGKVGTIVFFLFSIGIVISALKIVGNSEEKREEIERLTTSLEERNAELAQSKEEKAALETELEQERERLERERRLKERIERELNQEIKELREEVQDLQKEVRSEKEDKAALEKRFEELEKELAELEERYQKAQQTLTDLQARPGELPPRVEEPVVEILPPRPYLILVAGEVINVAQPFLSLELDREVVAGLMPALSIYREDELIKALVIRDIHHVTLVARAAIEKSLQGIEETDQVKLSLSPGVTEMFTAPRMEGKVSGVIRPGFLNINLGQEGLENIEPILFIYREGELFRKIELKELNRLTLMVEAIEGANVRGIREGDRVTLTQ